MGVSSIFLFFFLIYASIRWFPRRGHAVLMGVANSIGMVGWVIGNHFGRELVTCMALIFLVYTGIMIKNKGSFAKTLILVMKDKMSWYFGFVSLGFYVATFIFGTTWGNSLFVFLGLGIGGPCIGYLSDRVSQRRVFIIALNFIALTSIGAISYFSLMPNFLVGAFSFITGVCSSGYLLLYTLAIDHNHPKARGATAVFISALLFLGSAIVELHLEPPFLFMLLAITGIFALKVKDSPPEMEESQKILERLLAMAEEIPNS